MNARVIGHGKILTVTTALAAVPLALWGSAGAQTVPAAASAAPAGTPPNDDRYGGDIIVTATKRAENIQDVPISITALSQQSLETAGIIDPTRIGYAVAGVRIGSSGTEARIAIRGARTNNVGPEAQQVVGVFNDGAYVATVGQVMSAYLDVNRIEVLRGPQGTLYGRNTFAGAINIISNEPKFDAISGYANITYGAYSRIRGEAAINLPITDTLAIRIAGLGEKHDGYIINTYTDGPADDLRNENVQIGRITAKWKPDTDFDLTLRYTKYHRDINSEGAYGYTQIGCYQNLGDPTTATGLSATATYRAGNCFAPGPDSLAATYTPGQTPGRAATGTDSPYVVSRDSPSRGYSDGDDINLQANYSIGFATLSFLGAYNHYSSLSYYDSDYSNGYYAGTDSLDNGFAGYDNHQRSYSGELRLASNGSTRLKWLLGAYYFRQETNDDFGYLVAGKFTRYDTVTDAYVSQSRAVFANGSLEILNGLRILGGVRYNDDSNRLIGGADGGGGSKVTWRAGLEYDVAHDILLYGTASTGYRVGGVNGSTLVAAGAPAVFGPETVTAYEAGVKSQLFNRSLTVNAAFFYNFYRNMQAQSFVTACIDPNKPTSCTASEFTSNGGAIDAKGIELEFNWRPGRSFFANGSVSFLDAKFGNYLVSQLPGLGNYEGRQDVTRSVGQIIAAGGVPGLQLRGWRPALSPPLSTSLTTGYIFDIDDNNTITPLAQVYYSSKYWSYDYNVPGSEQSAYAKLDLRLTWRNKAKGISLEGFVENVTNHAVLVRSVIFEPGLANYPTASIQANYADPRIWGVRVGYDF